MNPEEVTFYLNVLLGVSLFALVAWVVWLDQDVV